MGLCGQYNALLRKSYILKRRQFISTLFELCLPAIIFLVLVLIKSLVTTTSYDASLQLDEMVYYNQTSRASYLDELLTMRGSKIAFYPPEQSEPLRNFLILQGFNKEHFVTFDNADEIQDYTQDASYGSQTPPLMGAIEITNLNGPNYEYALRFNATSDKNNEGTGNTAKAVYSLFDSAYNNKWKVFDKLGFTLFQDLIDTYILTKENVYKWQDTDGTGENTFTMELYDQQIKRKFQPFPTKSYIVDDFASVVGTTLGLILTLIYIWPLTRIITGLVEEKELKLKASMQLMGLSSTSLFLSWLTTYTIMFAITSVLLCLCSFWGVYENSFIIFIFFIYFFFGLCVFAIAYLVSAFFSSAKTASTMGAVILLVTSFVSFVINEETPASTKTALCLIPTVCLSQIASSLSKLESMGVGLTTTTVGQEIENFSVQTGILFLLLDFFIYIIIGLYFNQITKSEFGISKPWNFLCKSSFWVGTSYSRKGTPLGCCFKETLTTNSLPQFDPLLSNEPDTFTEPPLRDDVPIIQVRNLRKTYPGTSGEKKNICARYPDFVAVKGLSFDAYAGQILVLLGQNGAGKSTTFNMLTGLITPTSGDALINGYSLTNDIQQIYQQQGVCFQHDVLYPNLTVYEHMLLFSAIKDMNLSKDELHHQIMDLLKTVGLGPDKDNKVNSAANTLSGGQRRRLSIALSLLSNPKVLFLDELTTGVDVESSRGQIWPILLKVRARGCAIVMTTHDMAEAAAIADRIAIIAAGKLVCSGSVMALKKQYGVGYTLSINKSTRDDLNDELITYNSFDKKDNGDGKLISPEENANKTNRSDLSTLEGSSQDYYNNERTKIDRIVTPSTKSGQKISKFMQTNFPFAALSNDTVGEILFRLPVTESAQFPNMLDSLDNNKNILGITTYGLGVTTLTEVFLRAVAGQSRDDIHETISIEDESNNNKNNNNNGDQVVQDWGKDAGIITTLSTSTIFWTHFRALFLKRWQNFLVDRKAAVWTLLYPGIILFIGLLSLEFVIKNEYPRRVMNPSIYPEQTQFIIGNPLSTNQYIADIHEKLTQIATERYSHDVIDVTTTNNTIAGFQQWLSDEYNLRPFNQTRFGGILFTEMENIPADNDAILNPYLEMSLHINSTAAPDALPVYTNLINNVFLAAKNPDATITMTNAPLPRAKMLLSYMGSTTAFIVAIAMAFVPASYAAYIVRERQDNIKHLQMVSGVSNLAYWASNMAWDIVNFILPFLLTMILLIAFNIEPLMGVSNLILIILALWLFVLASCPFTYALSFLFDSHTTAQNMTLLINFLTSVILLILSFLLTMLDSTRSANRILRFFYRLLPGFSLGDVFMQLLLRKTVHPEATSGWDMDLAGWNLVFFIVDFILYSGLIILFEHWSSNNTLEWLKGGCGSISAEDDELFQDPEEDDDVKAMREKIQRGECDPNEYPIILKGIRKVFPSKKGPPFLAVANVFYAVKKGTVMSILGANGSGKTTQVKVLTSDLAPSKGSGDALLGGLSLLQQPEKTRHVLGYCPQFDALLPLLTGRQHLELYASIKCVQKDKINGYVNFLLQKLGLVHLADRAAGTYSGGNKRKLSLGIAIIGNPLVLFLDEISSGVDQTSKRGIWDLISSTMANRAVLLISHSLEEVEALSTNIAIFASGRIRAYGSSLHLTQRHGDGLQVELQCSEGKQDDVKAWFSENFNKGVTIVEEYRVTLKYSIPKKDYNITNVFRMMENAKKSGIGLDSYQVSDTSLDQIFIKFVRDDDERRARNGGLRL